MKKLTKKLSILNAYINFFILKVSNFRLEYYIEELLDKIIVEDKVKSGLEIRLFGNYTIKYDLTKEG